MTLPLPKKTIFGSPATRNNWLDRYLGVEKVADQQLYRALTQATKDIDASLAALASKQGKTAKVRRLQLALAHKQIRATMNGLYGDKVTKIIRSGHSNAAAAAVQAALKDEAALLKKIFPNPPDAAEYAKSLRLSARRDIDATMTRVLQSNIPLSQRVWRSRALSQGMVDRAINAALARGDSYEQLAKAVHHLVSPDTPGGVTYAAKRLARTEINNAYHAQSIRDAQEKPWVTQMRWHLSKRHLNYPGDPCETYALQALFPIESVPEKPHPHCRCFVTPEQVNDIAFDRMLDSGQMDSYLDNFISGG